MGSVGIETTWPIPAALSWAAWFCRSVIWSQHGWQVSPSWKNSSTVWPRNWDRLMVPPVLAASENPGAAWPDRGLPTWYGYAPVPPDEEGEFWKITNSTAITAATPAAIPPPPTILRPRRRP